MVRVEPRIPPGDDLLLVRRLRIIDQDLQQEPVELGLGQRIRPLILYGVFGGEYGEDRRERVTLAVDRRLPLLHRLEERGLGLRRRTVDLVREQDIREDRPLPQRELRRLHVEDVRSRDVRGHQVRRELNPREFGPKDLRQRLHRQGFRRARNSLQQRMPLRQHGDKDLLDHFVLPDDGLAKFVDYVSNSGGRVVKHSINGPRSNGKLS